MKTIVGSGLFLLLALLVAVARLAVHRLHSGPGRLRLQAATRLQRILERNGVPFTSSS